MNSLEQIQKIRTQVEAMGPVSDELWTEFEACLNAESLNKASYLIRIGEPVEKLYFVLEGLMRVYYLNEDGQEINRSFVFENRFYTNTYSLVTGFPSNYQVEALEDTVLMAITRSDLERLYSAFPETNLIGRRFAEQMLVEKEEKEQLFRSKSPEEHYLLISQGGSKLADRIPQYHLATYLGVAPETLSRIRKRLRQKNKP